jgi:hypothetical protein
VRQWLIHFFCLEIQLLRHSQASTRPVRLPSSTPRIEHFYCPLRKLRR